MAAIRRERTRGNQFPIPAKHVPYYSIFSQFTFITIKLPIKFVWRIPSNQFGDLSVYILINSGLGLAMAKESQRNLPESLKTVF